MKQIISLLLIIFLLFSSSMIVYADNGVHGIYVGKESESPETNQENPQTGLGIGTVVFIFVLVSLIALLISFGVYKKLFR